ncbi:carbon-nitrogen hydrolase family protein [Eubacteriales bacterium OttesenSCG-928-K08]|nr:carbon-nitrogen hydrolase family protein [Eubacteriales bacterium OttesenSCG-928-K08]
MKLALCQLDVTPDKQENIRRAYDMLLRAADCGAQMAILPEMFSIAYVARLFDGAAEACPDGECGNMLSKAAKQTGMFIIGGSIPERENNGRIFNTSMSFGPDGSFLGKYRKAHLFDVDVPGAFRFMESDAIAQGDEYPLVLDAPLKTGVNICFDIRFPEWARLVMQSGCDLLALPAAFSRNTGPRHWELLLRARALDNQLFVAAVSPAQSKSAYGHSMLVSPDGTVLLDCGEEECVRVVELDPTLLSEMRQSIPVQTARRLDLYQLTKKAE